MEKSFKYTSFEVIYLFWVLLFVARPAAMFMNIDPRLNPVSFATYLVPSIFLYYRYGLSINLKMVATLGIYSIYVGIHVLQDADLKILSYLLIYAHLFVGYTLVQVFREELFGYFWRIVTVLTAIDIILWIPVHFFSSEQMESWSLLEPASSTSSASFLIFNSPSIERYGDMGMLGLVRNCGFAWEPGLFGSIIVMALYFNLAEREYQFMNNKSLYILLFGLFTTFSTTAYTAAFILFGLRLLFSLKTEVTLNRMLAVLLLVGAIFASNRLPFMREKIQEDVSMQSTVTDKKNAMKYIKKEGELITVQRTEGLVLDYMNYRANPTWGYGMDRTNSFVFKQISPLITTSNDITSFLARWGWVFTLLWVPIFLWNSYMLRKNVLFDDNSFFLIFLVLSVSYPLSMCALCMSFLLYHLFLSSDPEEEEETEEDAEEEEELEYDYIKD